MQVAYFYNIEYVKKFKTAAKNNKVAMCFSLNQTNNFPSSDA